MSRLTSHSSGAVRVAPIAALISAALSTSLGAEPVHLESSGGEGSGYTFRRGTTCTVLTANHVVQEEGGLSYDGLVVLDRSGAKAAGEVVYTNPVNDLALVALPDNTDVACSTAWPAAAAAGALDSSTRLEAVRHYPDGRESLILLSYAGGTQESLMLAPVDRTTIRESDSGSIVMLKNRPAGIVQRVHTADDRVEVLRFETIDQLVGARFRSAAGERALALAGAFQRGRENPAWTTYVRSWLVDQAKWNVLPPGSAQASCSLQVNVMDWSRANEANPDYADAQENAKKLCESSGLLAKQLCKVAERKLEDEPRTLMVHTIMLEASMTLPSGTAASKLGTVKYSHAAGAAQGSAQEAAALQTAVAGVVGPMFEAGGCR